MTGRPRRALMGTAAGAAASTQVGILSAWAAGHPWPLLLAWAVFALAAGSRLRLRMPKALAPLACGLAFGGLGMLVGAWIDAGFCAPPCMCCSWGPNVSASVMLRDYLGSWSARLMGLGCIIAMAPELVGRARAPSARVLYLAVGHLMGMLLGMAAVMRPTSAVIRHIPWGKLTLGHGGMLLGMAMGATVCAAIVHSVANWVDPKQRPHAG